MSRGGRCGRVDLVQALGRGGDDLLGSIAAMLGYAKEESPSEPQRAPDRSGPTAGPANPLPEPEIDSQPLLDSLFWYPYRYEEVIRKELPPPPPPTVRPVWRNRPSQPPAFRLLAPWRDLEPRLRRGLGATRAGSDLDVRRILRALCRGRLIHHLPRCRRRAWGAAIQIIVDRSEHLVPFWQDQDQVCGELALLFGRYGVERAVFHEGLDQPRLRDAPDLDYRPPPAGGTVLVLGDLGCLTGADPRRDDPWLALGERLAAAGCRAVALLPGPVERCPEPLRRRWQVLPWERPCGGAVTHRAGLRARAERLLQLVSPTVRIEPGLLRTIRLSLPATEADAGTEADVWQLPAVSSTSSVAGTLDPKAAGLARVAFAAEDPTRRKEVLEAVRIWRQALPAEIWFDELCNLDSETRALCDPDDVQDAEAFFEWLAVWRGTPPEGDTITHQVARGFIRRVKARATPHFWQGRVGELLQRWVWDEFKDDPLFTPPPGFDPAAIGSDPLTKERVIGLWHRGNAVVAAETGVGLGAGSLLATVRTANGLVTITEEMGEDRAAFWKTGRPPPWAADWGRDGFGAWATFSVTGAEGEKVTQRLRWIPSGRFLMGSPESEVERRGNEGPQHSVTISRGFWLMDTACTQGLWQAVMGDNPSRFKLSPDHPVEQVSWDDVQGFLARLNARVPGLGLNLPTEAQWEYACRAGTTTPFSFGATITPEQVNYGGRAKKTVPVASLPANPWGLYEMHGNVWEWCLDDPRTYEAKSETDPHGSLKTGEARVIRGGSWDGTAQNARAAYRGRHRPDDRNDNLGFRCIPVQDVSPAGEGGAEPADPALVREAERRTAQGRPSGAVLRLDRDGLFSPPEAGAFSAQGLIPKARSFCILTDRERLSFGRITQPDWATAMGRDRFGLWTSFDVPVPDGAEPITQRLRWVPPGRFRMGSPGSEEGRFDGEGPQHSVTISRGFWLMDTACTQGLWQAVMGDNPSQFKLSPDHPVEQVSWNDVQGFLARLNARVPGLGLNLPTEAQWEYACRAGTTTPFSFGATITSEQVNYNGKFPYAGGEKGVYRAKTVLVASLPANPWGLYGMHGNVWEWCLDGMRDYAAEAETDPHGSLDTGEDRVIRGGSWHSPAQFARAAYRNRSHRGSRSSSLGFRCIPVQS